MRKNLLSVGVLLLGISLNAQFLSSVGNGAVVTILPDALVYNGGGINVAGTGKINNYGNIMMVGAATGTASEFVTSADDSFNLLASTTDPENRYGQLYIQSISQTNLKGIVNKEYRTVNNGTYQQIGLPFFDKSIASLGTELGKTFTNTRYSQNEVLTWTNATAVSDNYNINTLTSNPTNYYMLGAKNTNFAINNKLKGRPYTELAAPLIMQNAASAINFQGGYARNAYNERYNTYLQDFWDDSSGAWTGNYGKNIYQYANPFFTNLDLTGIYQGTSTDGDLNFINNIQGIRFAPGTVVTSNTGTYSTNAKNVTFSTVIPTSPTNVPVGDVNNLVIKPLQTFVIKLKGSGAQTLNFNTLRRFKYTPSAVGSSGVTSGKGNFNQNTVKQLGVIAYDKDNNEMGRTYYVIYANGVSGHTDNSTTQISNSSTNIIGTFEENATTGGIDSTYENMYWLYINEANEEDFKGKSVSMNLYSSEIKNLKFEIRENAELVSEGTKELSSGVGFYFKDASGVLQDVSQDGIVAVNGDSYSLYYGKPEGVLATGAAVRPSRTTVVYNPSIDDYIIRFDPTWKKAEVQVFDLSGKLVLAKQNISTASDFIITLSKEKRAYIVTAVSESGEKASAKIVR